MLSAPITIDVQGKICTSQVGYPLLMSAQNAASVVHKSATASGDMARASSAASLVTIAQILVGELQIEDPNLHPTDPNIKHLVLVTGTRSLLRETPGKIEEIVKAAMVALDAQIERLGGEYMIRTMPSPLAAASYGHELLKAREALEKEVSIVSALHPCEIENYTRYPVPVFPDHRSSSPSTSSLKFWLPAVLAVALAGAGIVYFSELKMKRKA